MKFEYRGIEVEVVKEDDQYCFSFTVHNHLFLGQFNTEEEAIKAAMKDIDGLD